MDSYKYDMETYLEAVISFVIAIKQTDQSTNQKRPCTTILRIM
jgi:hypothetical protein